MDILVEKRDGKVIWPDDVKQMLAHIQDWYYMLSLRKWAKRTLEQNALYRAILGELSKDIGHHPDELHTFFKSLFLRNTYVHDGLWEVTEITSTTKLTTKTFTEYIEKIIQWCAEQGYEVQI